MQAWEILEALEGKLDRLKDRGLFEEAVRGAAAQLRHEWSLRDLFEALTLLGARYPDRAAALAGRVEGLPRAVRMVFRRVGVGAALDDLDLLKAVHVIHLYSGDQWFRDLNVILYASLRALPERKHFCAAALSLLLAGRRVDALALAAYASGEGDFIECEPWLAPDDWADAVYAAYMADVSLKVIREVLSHYRFRDHFLETLRGDWEPGEREPERRCASDW